MFKTLTAVTVRRQNDLRAKELETTGSDFNGPEKISILLHILLSFISTCLRTLAALRWNVFFGGHVKFYALR